MEQNIEQKTEVRKGTVIALEANNFKNLKAVRLTLNGKSAVISGKNGAGKSAVLDALFYGVTGKSPDMPIRKGEDKAEIFLEFENSIVKRVKTEKSSTLTITSKKDGAKYSSPQKLLDDTYGPLSFDPIAFAKLKPKDQYDVLIEITGISFSDIDKRIEEFKAQKGMAISERNNYRGQLNGLIEPTADTPDEEIDIIGLVNRKQKLDQTLTVYNKKTEAIERCDDYIAECQSEIQRLNDRITELNRTKKEHQDCLKNYNDEATRKEIAEINEKLATAAETNQAVKNAQEYRRIKKCYDESLKTEKSLNAQIYSLESEKQDVLASAKYPVEKLSFGDGVVLYDDIPFSQLNTGHQVKISTLIGMALNPKMKIMLVRDGSLLDDDGLKELIKMTEEQGYQLLLERVGKYTGSGNGEIGVVIEEGEVIEVN